MDEIVEFAELRDYIDEPVRTYSSGMYMRLAFSTAIHIDPEIFIVDEILAVGDGAFVEKCTERMDRFKRLGKTIILVSHNLPMVSHWCHEAVWLDGGCIKMKGEPGEVVEAYQGLLSDQQQQGRAELSQSPVIENREEARVLRYGDGSCRIVDFGILDSSDRKTTEVESGQRCTLFMRVRFNKAITRVSASFLITDRMNSVVYGVNNLLQNVPIGPVQAGEGMTVTANITMWLAAGEYFVNLMVTKADTRERCVSIEDAIRFAVFGPGGILTNSVVNLQTEFAVSSDLRGPERNPEKYPTQVLSYCVLQDRAKIFEGRGPLAAGRCVRPSMLTMFRMLVSKAEKFVAVAAVSAYLTIVAALLVLTGRIHFSLPGVARKLLSKLRPPFKAEILEVTHEKGHCFLAPLGKNLVSDANGRSRLALFEDGKPLPHPHSIHADIREFGNGRYSHWGDALYFSSSDNTDPFTNGRRYSVRED